MEEQTLQSFGDFVVDSPLREPAAARRLCAEHVARFPNHPFSRSCPNVAP